MSEQEYRYTLHGIVRNDQGKGASRRLRREGWVPAIVYGGNEAPKAIAIKQDELKKNAKHDSFFSQIINLKIEGEEDTEILVRDVQHHAYKPLFQHFDFQRIVRGQELNATVVLRFDNEETAVGVKAGGILSKLMLNVDITCRPRHLPEFIGVDVGALAVGDAVYLSDLQLPEGVRLAGERSEEELAQTVVAHVVHAQLPADGGDEVNAGDVPAINEKNDD